MLFALVPWETAGAVPVTYLWSSPTGRASESDFQTPVSGERSGLVVPATRTAEWRWIGCVGSQGWGGRRSGGSSRLGTGAREARRERPVVMEAPSERTARGAARAPRQKQFPHPRFGGAQRGEAPVQAFSVRPGEVEAEGEGGERAADSETFQAVGQGGRRLEQSKVVRSAQAPDQSPDDGFEGVELGSQGGPRSGCVARFGDGGRVARQKVTTEEL